MLRFIYYGHYAYTEHTDQMYLLLMLTMELVICSDGRGILVKLHDDVQTCAYEDVQVMWEMLRRSETEKTAAGAPTTSKAARALVWLGTRRRHTMDLRPRC